MICRYCGKEISDQAKFCAYCGKDQIQRELESNAGQTIHNVVENQPDISKEIPQNKKSNKAPIIAGVIIIFLAIAIFAMSKYQEYVQEQERIAKEQEREAASDCLRAIFSFEFTGENNTDFQFSELAEEDYSEVYSKSLDDELKEIIDISDFEMTDECEQSLKDFIPYLYKNIKYDIGDAIENEEGYSVPVTLHPIIVSTAWNDDDDEKFVEQFCENYDEDEVNDDIIDSEIWIYLVNRWHEEIANPTYDNDYTFSVEVAKDDDGFWTVLGGYSEISDELSNHVLTIQEESYSE